MDKDSPSDIGNSGPRPSCRLAGQAAPARTEGRERTPPSSGGNRKKTASAQQSLILTMALVIAALAAALVLATYPWEEIAVHGVSLRRMLAAIAPGALLSVATVLFLAYVYSEARPGAEARAFSLARTLEEAAQGCRAEIRLPNGELPPASGDPDLVLTALAALLPESLEDSPAEIAVRAEGGALIVEFPGKPPRRPASRAAVEVLARCGVEMAADGEHVAMVFPAWRDT